MKIKSKILNFFAHFGIGVTLLVLVYLVAYITIKGAVHLTPSLFAFDYNSENVSMLPSLVTTIMMVVFSLALTIPLGVGTAIYLVEYAKGDNKFVKMIRLATETLAGIPSIIYGLFGMVFFVTYLKMNMSFLAGMLTVSIMILPTIIRSSEEALLAVAKDLREGSLGLGAGKLRTSFKIVLPMASSGIFSGIILAVGRIVGESAALIYTAGTVAQIPGTAKNGSIFSDSASTLAVHMNLLSSEGLHIDEAYATAFVLLIIVILINTFSVFLSKKLAKGK